MSGESRCERSPRPVCVGVVTRWPRTLKTSARRDQHQPPCQTPWTQTKVRCFKFPSPIQRLFGSFRCLLEITPFLQFVTDFDDGFQRGNEILAQVR